MHPFGNPRTAPHQGVESLLQNTSLPREARQVLVSKCADCHSNETRWPIYSRIAPASWLIERDVIDARSKMNLSNWQELAADSQEIMLGKILHEAKSGQMPPVQYRLLHRQSQLTSQDVAALSAMAVGGEYESAANSPGDAARGKIVFEKRCTGCHGSGDGREGPSLDGVFGRKAGSVPGFSYSAGLKSSGITWNEATLEKWLTDPDAMVPDNKMDFHLPKSQERSDVMAYFQQQSGARP